MTEKTNPLIFSNYVKSQWVSCSPMKHTIYVGNIRLLKPVEQFANHHDYNSGEDEEAQNKEEPEEPLGIMPEVTAIILLIAVHGLLAFFDQHSIDFPDCRLRLVDYPFSLLVEQVLNLLPIRIA